MSNDEIVLTTTDNMTSNGIVFPETPRPQIIRENFASYELNTSNENNNKNEED